MSVPSAINAVCSMLREATGLEIVVGRPDEDKPAVYLWPWRLEESRALRASAPFDPGPTAEPPVPGCEVHFLIMVTPALSAAGLADLETVRRALHANPVLAAGPTSFQIVPALLSIEESTRIFAAADLPLTLCCAAIVRSAPTG